MAGNKDPLVAIPGGDSESPGDLWQEGPQRDGPDLELCDGRAVSELEIIAAEEKGRVLPRSAHLQDIGGSEDHFHLG